MRNNPLDFSFPVRVGILSAVILLLSFGIGCKNQKNKDLSSEGQDTLHLDTAAYLSGFTYRDADGVIVGEGVRLRSAPGLRSEVVDKVNTGMLVKYLRKSEHPVVVGAVNPCYPDGNYWYEVITAHGKRGWVYGDFLYNLLHPGRMADIMRYTADGMAPKLINRQYHFQGTGYRLGFALAKQTDHQQSLAEHQDTICAELLLPYFYIDTARVISPWHFRPNPKNSIKMPHLATDRRLFQMAFGTLLTDRPEAFNMRERELLLSIARMDHTPDDPFIYTLRITGNNGHFTAVPLDPGKEIYPQRGTRHQ